MARSAEHNAAILHVSADGHSNIEWMTPTELFARGRVADCDCRMIACACVEARQHQPTCHYRKALSGAVAIACEHGFDVCPCCDPCTCESACESTCEKE